MDRSCPGPRRPAVSGDPLSPATSGAVQQLVGAASAAASAAKREASSTKAGVKTAKDLDARLQAIAARRADLAGAAEVLKKENFPAWARDQRIAGLVDAASQLLARMTGGRYRFDSHLRICDEVAGAVRAATRLSGGEKFEAALALALGVAEIPSISPSGPPRQMGCRLCGLPLPKHDLARDGSGRLR